MKLRDISLDREKQEAQLRRYMTDHRISAGLSGDVTRFARVNYGKLKVRIHEDDVQLWKDLPVRMRVELHKEVYKPVLLRHRAMRLLDNVAPMTLEYLCHLALGEQRYLAGQSVFSEGEVATKTFILQTGELNYYFCSRRGDRHLVQPGDWVSEAALWIHDWRYVGGLINGGSCCLRIGGFCELFCLDIADFYGVVLAVERTGANLDEVRRYARSALEAYSEQTTDLSWQPGENRNGSELFSGKRRWSALTTFSASSRRIFEGRIWGPARSSTHSGFSRGPASFTEGPCRSSE
jgi:hypothetical protein